ncbi:aldo/keto reductase [Amnibacterium sp. CER49]|uniref:aldo/keto reductase n=1 Tax=Amnibacterium sp. CER49 TaxID=3039161 RepID=UPI00244BEEF9|nr:aldo/keto reductase [Amnibacterium sp. CER49]MDH2442758.1 aldo/keto reductase [Amnibacterium sp. CER49]
MQSAPLGTTGLDVTRIVAGAPRAPLPVARGVDALGEAWDQVGVRAVDVTDLAAEGETAAERFLQERQPDDAVVLAGLGGTAGPERGADHSPARISRALEAASRRLGRVDLGWLAGADAATPLPETLALLASAIEDGRLRAWGAAGVDVWRLEALLTAADREGVPRPAFVRNRMNLLERGDERDLMPLAVGEGLGVLPRNPFASGRLTDRHVAAEEAAERAAAAGAPRTTATDPALPALLVLRDLARDRDTSTAALALAWLAGHASDPRPVVAATSQAVWETVHAALELDVDDELRERMSSVR